MIIYDNGLIKLDYDPTTDILFVDMPNVDHLVLPAVSRALAIIVENVRNYDVKRLLIDARKTEVDVPEETYMAMLSEFMRELLTTRIQKVARIVSSSTIREHVVKKVYEEKKLPLQLQSFTDVPPAVEWLTQ